MITKDTVKKAGESTNPLSIGATIEGKVVARDEKLINKDLEVVNKKHQ